MRPKVGMGIGKVVTWMVHETKSRNGNRESGHMDGS